MCFCLAGLVGFVFLSFCFGRIRGVCLFLDLLFFLVWLGLWVLVCCFSALFEFVVLFFFVDFLLVFSWLGLWILLFALFVSVVFVYTRLIFKAPHAHCRICSVRGDHGIADEMP